jgi:RES domain-containing protein
LSKSVVKAWYATWLTIQNFSNDSKLAGKTTCTSWIKAGSKSLEVLPEDWQVDPAPASTNDIGSTWAQLDPSLMLRVPSAVVPVEFNLILNIQHSDFGKLEFGKGQEFVFDSRLNC